MVKLGSKYLNIWDEPFMQSSLMTTELRVLYLYLITNALSNIAGVYKITDRRILFDLCNPSLNLKELFYQLRKMKKVYRCGDYVIIKDAPLYIKKKTKAIIKEMDSIIYDLPDKIKTKMKKIHYRYEHLYGEPLYEELQKLGAEKKMKALSKTKENKELINNIVLENISTSKPQQNNDFEKEIAQKEFDIMGGQNEKNSKRVKKAFSVAENEVHILENSQEQNEDGKDNETPTQKPINDLALEKKPCILEARVIDNAFTLKPQECNTSSIQNECWGAQEEETPKVAPLKEETETLKKEAEAKAETEEKKISHVFGAGYSATSYNENCDNTPAFDFREDYPATPQREHYNDEPKVKIGLDPRHAKNFFATSERRGIAQPTATPITKGTEKAPSPKESLKRPTETKPELSEFQRFYSKQVFKRFQEAGLYQGIDYLYFYKADFIKGLDILKERAIYVDDPKEAFALNEVIDAYLEKAKAETNAEKKVVMKFCKMCEAYEYNALNAVNY